MTAPLRGEVWWGELPDEGRRPWIVMTRSEAIPRLLRVVAVPVTRAIRGVATEVRLSPDDGLPTECAASFDNLDLVFRAYLTQRICTLGPERMAEACVALRVAVAC